MNGKGLVVACVMALLTALALPAPLHAQPDATAVRDQVQARFDVVALTGGVGLVPKTAIAGVRLIEVRDGAVTINGEAATAKDVRTRLGTDADLVLRVTYLDAAGLAALTGASGAPAVAPASPAPPAPPSTPDDPEPRRGRRRGDRQKDGIVRFGGSVTVEKGERVAGEVVVLGGTANILGTVEDELVVIGGTADVQGTVEGDVSVVGGTLTLGPQSVVEGDVTVAGGSVQRDSGARVDGKLEEVGIGDGKGSISLQGGWRGMRGRGTMRSVSSSGGLAGLLVRIVLLLLAVLATVALGSGYARPIAVRAGGEPLRSGGLGLLAEVLFVPVLVLTVVVLAVSIIGIPLLLLLPFALVLVLLVALVGFSGVALRLGDVILDRAGRVGDSPYLQAAVGVLAVMAVPLVGRILGVVGAGFLGGVVSFTGVLVEYLAWTVGFGAALWVLRQSRGRVPAPVDPPRPPADLPPTDFGPEMA